MDDDRFQPCWQYRPPSRRFLVAGCGDDDGGARAGPAEGTFVGKVEGSDAYIALVTDGTELTGYVCDGEQVSVWFGEPDLQDGRAELVSRRRSLLGRSRSPRTAPRAR